MSAAKRRGKVLLCSMPFGALERQALGLSLLKARLQAEGIRTDIRYLTFPFAELIGADDYYWITNDMPYTAFSGDWTFTEDLYGPRPEDDEAYIREILRSTWRLDETSISRLLRIRSLVKPFMEYCMAAVPWKEYAIVGFTSTFEQNIASLAMARRVKAAHPGVTIVFGGGNWEDEMGVELHRRFGFVDYACTGEADLSFPHLAKRIISGSPSAAVKPRIKGVVYRSRGRTRYTGAPELVRDLDSLPIPDYSDYFRSFEETSAGAFVVPSVLFESSRGCWWGAKKQCTFCGLNGSTLMFRTKSAERALHEVDYLVDRWGIDMVQAVDNVIDMGSFDDFLPSLARREKPIHMFYEVRANLSHSQVRMLGKAGVHSVQAGVESLNDRVLKLMRKGTTALQNIQVLKWCRECGVKADWNLIYGFPGETREDYEAMLRLLPLIRSLDPPTAWGPIRLDRFSPYFKAPAEFGLINLRPTAPYRYLYPFSKSSLMKIAYYFDYDYNRGSDPKGAAKRVVAYLEDWKAKPDTGRLFQIDRPDGGIALVDTRTGSARRTTLLKGLDGEVYRFCDRVRKLESIFRHVRTTHPRTGLKRGRVKAFLDSLAANRLMANDGDRYLSLALSPSADPEAFPLETAAGMG